MSNRAYLRRWDFLDRSPSCWHIKILGDSLSGKAVDRKAFRAYQLMPKDVFVTGAAVNSKLTVEAPSKLTNMLLLVHLQGQHMFIAVQVSYGCEAYTWLHRRVWTESRLGKGGEILTI